MSADRFFTELVQSDGTPERETAQIVEAAWMDYASATMAAGRAIRAATAIAMPALPPHMGMAYLNDCLAQTCRFMGDTLPSPVSPDEQLSAQDYLQAYALGNFSPHYGSGIEAELTEMGLFPSAAESVAVLTVVDTSPVEPRPPSDATKQIAANRAEDEHSLEALTNDKVCACSFCRSLVSTDQLLRRTCKGGTFLSLPQEEQVERLATAMTEIHAAVLFSHRGARRVNLALDAAEQYQTVAVMRDDARSTVFDSIDGVTAGWEFLALWIDALEAVTDIAYVRSLVDTGGELWHDALVEAHHIGMQKLDDQSQATEMQGHAEDMSRGELERLIFDWAARSTGEAA